MDNNLRQYPVHVMVDLETLATTNDAVILQLGACTFDPVALCRGINGGPIERFNAFITLQSQTDRRVDDAFLWWLKQEPAAQKVQSDAKRMPLPRALHEFSEWYRKWAVVAVWSHGANFDIGILLDAYTKANKQVPWGYRDMRDTRTLFDAAAFLREVRKQEKTPLPAFAGTQHDALDDAINQVGMVQRAYLEMRGDVE